MAIPVELENWEVGIRDGAYLNTDKANEILNRFVEYQKRCPPQWLLDSWKFTIVVEPTGGESLDEFFIMGARTFEEETIILLLFDKFFLRITMSEGKKQHEYFLWQKDLNTDKENPVYNVDETVIDLEDRGILTMLAISQATAPEMNNLATGEFSLSANECRISIGDQSLLVTNKYHYAIIEQLVFDALVKQWNMDKY